MSAEIFGLFVAFAVILMTAGANSDSQQGPVVINLQASSQPGNAVPLLANGQQQKAATEASSSTTVRPASSTSPPSYAKCGVANSNSLLSASDDGSRIVGGDQASPNEFPWQAFLNVEMTNGAIYYCGGTLIADRWILTAARCLVVSGQTLKSVGVYLGAHDIAATSEFNRKSYSGSQVFLHPDYNANNQNQAGDIAMIKLSAAVTYTQYIRPVCLATSTEPTYANSQVTVTGWGTTYDGSTALNSLLRKVTVPVITNSECSATYGGNVVTDKIICTSGANSRGTCIGDGGGPMNFRQTDGTWKQIGIVSFVSAAGCQRGYPSGYTRLSSYATWVQSVMSSNTVATTPKPSSANQSFAFLSSALVTVSLVISLKMPLLQ